MASDSEPFPAVVWTALLGAVVYFIYKLINHDPQRQQEVDEDQQQQEVEESQQQQEVGEGQQQQEVEESQQQQEVEEGQQQQEVEEGPAKVALSSGKTPKQVESIIKEETQAATVDSEDVIQQSTSSNQDLEPVRHQSKPATEELSAKSDRQKPDPTLDEISTEASNESPSSTPLESTSGLAEETAAPLTSDEVSVKPDQETPKSDEIFSKPEAATTTSYQTSEKPDEASEKSEEASEKPIEVSENLDVSSANTKELSANMEDTSTKPDETLSRSDEKMSKTSKSDVSSSRFDESSAKSEETSIESYQDEAYAKPEETSTKPDEASTKPDEASSKSNETLIESCQVSAKHDNALEESDVASTKPDEESAKTDETSVKPGAASEKPDEASEKPDEASTKPNETTVNTDETSAQPDETSAQPDKTSAKPDETSGTTDETSAKPDETSVKPGEASEKPDEASGKPDEASEKPDQPDEASTRPNETSVKTDETLVKSEETSAKADTLTETSVKSDETSVQPDETSAKTDETSAKSDETSTKADETSVKHEEAYGKLSETIAKTDETPANIDETSAKSSETSAEPGKSFEKRDEASQKPDETSEKLDQPDEVSTKPNVTSAKADETSVKPNVTSAKADETSAKADVTSAKADETSVKPNEAFGKPDETFTKTDKSSTKSDEASYKPDEASDKPDEASDKPDEASDKPDEASDKPDETSAEPSETSAEPDETSAEHKPDEASHKPDEASDKPDEASDKPDEASHKPDEASHKPDEASHKPDEASHKPDEASHKPDEASHKPDEASHKPDEASHKPDETSAEPDDPSAEPDETSDEPDEASDKPDETSHKPDGASHKSDETSAEPDDPSAEPDETSAKPDGASAKPDEISAISDDVSSKSDEASEQPDKASTKPDEASPNEIYMKSEEPYEKHDEAISNEISANFKEGSKIFDEDQAEQTEQAEKAEQAEQAEQAPRSAKAEEVLQLVINDNEQTIAAAVETYDDSKGMKSNFEEKQKNDDEEETKNHKEIQPTQNTEKPILENQDIPNTKEEDKELKEDDNDEASDIKEVKYIPIKKQEEGHGDGEENNELKEPAEIQGTVSEIDTELNEEIHAPIETDVKDSNKMLKINEPISDSVIDTIAENVKESSTIPENTGDKETFETDLSLTKPCEKEFTETIPIRAETIISTSTEFTEQLTEAKNAPKEDLEKDSTVQDVNVEAGEKDIVSKDDRDSSIGTVSDDSWEMVPGKDEIGPVPEVEENIVKLEIDSKLHSTPGTVADAKSNAKVMLIEDSDDENNIADEEVAEMEISLDLGNMQMAEPNTNTQKSEKDSKGEDDDVDGHIQITTPDDDKQEDIINKDDKTLSGEAIVIQDKTENVTSIMESDSDTDEDLPEDFQPTMLQKEAAPKPKPVQRQLSKPFQKIEDFDDIDSRAVEISKGQQKNFRELVWKLVNAKKMITKKKKKVESTDITADISDDLGKARAIFLWLCTKDLSKLVFEDVPKGSPEENLMNLQQGQTTYADVYETMCRHAALHCETIKGYAKGYTKGSEYKPGMRFSDEDGRHVWNAVLVDGEYQLVDCHWAARRLVGKEVENENIRYELDEYYFMPEPEQLIYSHFPDDPQWQLLQNQLALSDFEELVPVKPAFFKQGFSIVSHNNAVVTTEGEVTIKIGVPKDKLSSMAYIFKVTDIEDNSKVNEMELNRYAMQRMCGEESCFTVRPPLKGSYYVMLYAKDITQSKKDGVYGSICQYRIDATSDGTALSPYPPCARGCWGPGDSCHKYKIHPHTKEAIIIANEGKAEVRIDMEKTYRFTSKLKSHSYKEGDLQGYLLHRVIGNTAVFTIALPSDGEYGLEIYANDADVDGNSLYHVYQYLVLARDVVAGTVKPLPPFPPGYMGPQAVFALLGLKAIIPEDPFVETDSGDIKVTLTKSLPIHTLCQLFQIEDGKDKDITEFVMKQGHEDDIMFQIRLPQTGVYKFQIYGLPSSDAGDSVPSVYNYVIKCNQVAGGVVPFPKQYSPWKEGCRLVEPLQGVLCPGDVGTEKLSFKMDVPAANSVEVIVGNDWTPLKNTDGIWSGEVSMQEHWGSQTKATVCANFDSAKASYSTLLEYTLATPTETAI